VVRVSSDAGPRIDVTVGASGRVESIIVAENSHQSHLEPLLARIAEIVNGALDDWDQQLLDSVGGLTKEQSAELKESLNSRLLQIQEESVRSMRAVTQSLAEVLRHTKGQGK
jgi:DNA anti-recombination protein RmuC